MSDKMTDENKRNLAQGESMSLTIEQTDAAILATFHSMEEGVDYVLNDFWFAEMNRHRKECGYSFVKDKKQHLLSRKGEKLLLNGNEAFDFKDKTNLAFALALAFSLAFSFSLAFALALQCNGIEKLNKDTCEGKVVDIDGRKYKLTAV
jgi:hypothetical protein